MTEAAAWVLVGLVAVLVAAAVPVLLQLRKTLKTAQETLDTTGRHVNGTLDQLTATLERVNRAADGLEQGVVRVSGLLEVLGGIGDGLTKVKSSISSVASLGSIVGGALIAAFGLKSRRAASEREREREHERAEPRVPGEKAP